MISETAVPPKVDTDNIGARHLNISVTAAQLKRIDDWRRHKEILPTLSAAVRQLIEAGLERDAKPPRKR